jgi:tetratricopeptide (TPR) repeat protein
MKLRVLSDVDSTEALDAEAEAWFALDPSDEGPYREVSRVYERALGPEEALEVLRKGREAVGDRRALAMDMGDLLAELGETDRALDEWAAAVVREPSRAGAVEERLAGLVDPEAGARRVVEGVLPGAQGIQLRAAASIAVAAGLEDEAAQVAKAASDRLEGRARGGFLADLARRAGEEGMSELEAWAYAQLGEGAESVGERRRFDQRLVEASLAAGDTAEALEAQRRLAGSFSEGSVDRRTAVAQVVRLEASSADPARLRSLLDSFRAEYPDAPELDDLAATVARRLLARDDASAAADVLEGIDGPRSNLERGYILMSRGDVALGRQAILMAVPGLPPAEATGLIQLAGLLGRVSPPGVRLLSEAHVMAHRGRPLGGADRLAQGVDSVPAQERATLLAEAARLAGQEDGTEATGLWRRVLEDHPDAPEAAEAALEVAKALGTDPEGREEAMSILEQLITSRPNAAVVPTARRELERLRRSGT